MFLPFLIFPLKETSITENVFLKSSSAWETNKSITKLKIKHVKLDVAKGTILGTVFRNNNTINILKLSSDNEAFVNDFLSAMKSKGAANKVIDIGGVEFLL